jgi:hypothetical protein
MAGELQEEQAKRYYIYIYTFICTSESPLRKELDIKEFVQGRTLSAHLLCHWKRIQVHWKELVGPAIHK